MKKQAKRSRNYRLRKKILEHARIDPEEDSTSEPTSSSTSHPSSYSRRDRSSDYVNSSSDNEFDADISLEFGEQDISFESSQSVASLTGDGESEDDNNHGEDGSTSGSTYDTQNSEDDQGSDDDSIHSTGNCIDQSHQQELKSEITRLREWAVITQIPAVHLDTLLKILRERLLPEYYQQAPKLFCSQLGFMLRIFNSWEEGQPSVKLSAAQRNEMDRRTQMIKKDIPFEFKRKMRSMNEFADYKATDHRFFVIYASPIVPKEILNHECYNHSMLFHVACRMLSSKVSVNHVRLAREYLKEFVEKSKELHGLKFLSLNIH
ncbi:hypothetical protein QAD02_003211 [Eretmocerus hayati]|uniref:Uncharacterized protein n=1 Tax=Eretmocerus hayati TaxID=131215 RepID=A0ACC2NNZ3_9HYME|nr:hypothetical protein QAD02_003211 [Eretmocerus hayati]